MKKIVSILFLILMIVAVVFYRLSTTPKNEVVETSSESEENETNIPPSLKTTTPQSTVITEDATVTIKEENGIKIRERESNDPEFMEYDKIERMWLATVEKIVGSKFYPLYLQMKRANDQEKLQAYKEFHDYLRQKYGDKYSYHLSEDQSKREKDINQRYLKELHKQIGTETFQRYLKARDDFNEAQRRKNKDTVIMEF